MTSDVAAKRRIITVTGADRPGLVSAVSSILAAEGADIEDVSMTRLSGNFATILLARGGQEETMTSQLEQLARDRGLYIHVGPAVEELPDHAEANCFISAAGPNRVGIVAAISRILAAHEANITEMTTRLLSRTQVPIYLVRLEAVVGRDWDELACSLAEAAKELGIEIRFEALEDPSL